MANVPAPPRFVMLAFDGSKNFDFWNAPRGFARSAGVRFTYFVTGKSKIGRLSRRRI